MGGGGRHGCFLLLLPAGQCCASGKRTIWRCTTSGSLSLQGWASSDGASRRTRSSLGCRAGGSTRAAFTAGGQTTRVQLC